jgi:hypothetical protein
MWLVWLGFLWETATHRNTHLYGLANWLAQCGNGLSRAEAYRKPVLVSAADYCSLAGILSDPNNPFGVHKDFHAVHIFKHDKVHVASFWSSLLALLRNGKITVPFGRLRRKSPLHPQPIVNNVCSKLRQATAPARIRSSLPKRIQIFQQSAARQYPAAHK